MHKFKCTRYGCTNINMTKKGKVRIQIYIYDQLGLNIYKNIQYNKIRVHIHIANKY